MLNSPPRGTNARKHIPQIDRSFSTNCWTIVFFTCIEVQGKEYDCAPVSSWIQVYPPGSGARSLAPARDSPDGDQESDYQDESQR